MLTRIVKMEVTEEFSQQFLDFFNTLQTKIQSFEGCKSAQMLQDLHSKTTFFTISIWEDERALNNYRDSELFIDTWKFVKPNFTQKAAAWSLISSN